MRFERSSGVLLHPTSLPGPFGIGDVGSEAHKFVDFLEASGQKLWQIMPLGPTGFGNSPYSSFSAFAGNTLLVNPEQLIEDNLLTKEDLK
ncbi:MAG TPA: 4-alpha-glucanotransferase, partial [Blastocatellia bacterium]|nr:4-alpha-glucanotransferase [Blastocatellia bacterium]